MLTSVITKTGGTAHVSPTDFQSWLRVAGKGRKLSYATGDLAFDCYYNSPVGVLVTLRQLVWLAYKMGQIDLFQRKLPEGQFEYIAIRKDEQQKQVISLSDWKDATRRPR